MAARAEKAERLGKRKRVPWREPGEPMTRRKKRAHRAPPVESPVNHSRNSHTPVPAKSNSGPPGAPVGLPPGSSRQAHRRGHGATPQNGQEKERSFVDKHGSSKDRGGPYLRPRRERRAPERFNDYNWTLGLKEATK